MDTETRERLERIESKLDASLETRARFEAHAEREGGHDIHHIPPCQSFREWQARDEAARENRLRNVLIVAGIVAGLVGTAVTILSKLILG